ncbi:hypothetical protein MPSEU_000955900 [Mayamaea pseudoterrestris]|nr:hypothetical protein MPSEU_000955900 [Mayamaea pseudoterrestris]
MSDDNASGSNPPPPPPAASASFSRFAAFGSSLRAQAQELQAKAAEGVTKISEQAKTVSLTTPKQSNDSATAAASDANASQSNAASAADVASPAPSLASLKSDSVSKEDLLEILQKLNKKVKALSIMRTQLTEKCETVEREKTRLKELVVDEILNGAVDLSSLGDEASNVDEVLQIQLAWRRLDEEKQMSLQQLQQEFQKMALAQQQTSESSSEAKVEEGDSMSASEWQAEKQALQQQHEQETSDLRAKLEQLQEQQSANEATATDDASAKIKAAAQQQLVAFKKKVAAARQEEIAKLKKELADQAATDLEAKLAEQARDYEAKIAMTAASSSSGEDGDSAAASVAMLQQQVEDLKQQQAGHIQSLEAEHAQKIAEVAEKTRQQVEQALTTDMEERLQECMGDLKRNHALELEAVQQQAALQLAKASQKTNSVDVEANTAKEQIAALQVELEASRKQREDAVDSLQKQLDSVSSEKEGRLHSLESELDTQKQQFATILEKEQSLAAELEQARITLAAAQEEKDAAFAKFQAKSDEAHKSHEDDMLTQQSAFEAEISKLKLEYENQLKELQAKLNDNNGRNEQVEALQSELLAVKMQNKDALESLQAQLDLKSSEYKVGMQTVQSELDTQLELVASIHSREESLADELEQARNALLAAQEEKDAIRSASKAQQEHADRSINAARVDQQAAFEGALSKLKAESDEQLEALRSQLESNNAARTAAEAEISSLKARLIEIDNGKAERESNLEKQLKETLALLASKEEEQETTSQNLLDAQSALDETKEEFNKISDELALVKENNGKETAALESSYQLKVAELTGQLDNKERQLGALSSSDSEQSAAFSDLQNVYNDLQAKHQTLELETGNSLQSLRTEVETALREKAKLESTLSENKELLAAANATYAKQIEELQSRLTAATCENNSQAENHKKEYAAMCEKVSHLEAASSTSTMQIAFDTRIKKLTDGFDKQLKVLQREKDELLEASVVDTTSIESFSSRVTELTQALDQKDLKIEELMKQADALLESLRKKEEHLSLAHDEHEASLSKLKADLELAQQQIANAAKVASIADNKVECSLRELSVKKDEEMTLLKTQYNEELTTLRDELDAARADVEQVLASRMEKQKTEFEDQISNIERLHAEEKEEMRKSMETHIDTMKTRFKEKLDAMREEAATELKRAHDERSDQEGKLTKVVERLNALTATTTALRDEKVDLTALLEAERSKCTALQEEQVSLKKSIDETVKNSSDTATELLQQQEKLEKEKAALSEQLAKLKIAVHAKSNKVEELTGKVEALTANLNDMAEQGKNMESRLRTAAENEARLKVSESEVDNLREQINRLKLEMTQNNALVSRLQSEQDAKERSQGERSALVGMLETQLSELNDKNSDLNAKLEAALYDLNQREECIQTSEDRIRKLEKELADAMLTSKRTSDALVLAQKGADANSSKRVDALQKELQTVKQQMARKSAAAQKMLQEREAECAELRKSTKALQHEVEKGSLSDRKIFELAEKQSNRESMLASEIEARNRTIDQLQAALISRDDELASVEAIKEKAEMEVNELCRLKRREDVNIDYLKGIIVQYLSLPSGSTERAGLLPVIATLLQFNPQDYRRIEEGKNKISWWGSIAPTLISAPAATLPGHVVPNNGGVAEVMVTPTSAPQDGRRPTSLQF